MRGVFRPFVRSYYRGGVSHCKPQLSFSITPYRRNDLNNAQLTRHARASRATRSFYESNQNVARCDIDTSIHSTKVVRYACTNFERRAFEKFLFEKRMSRDRIFYSIKICICRVNSRVRLSPNTGKKIGGYREKWFSILHVKRNTINF